MAVSEGVRDWRSERLTTTYSWFELPDSIERQLTELLRVLGLDYAASDFIVTEAGEFYYLESNPHGAWLWLEEKLDAPLISRAVADFLLASVSKDA